jgi:GNAT superfamily N-acetyltransferase
MKLVEVQNSATVSDFHKVPFSLYKKDPNWIPHLKQDINDVFNKETNPTYKNGEAIRWVLYDDKGKAIGRVAAFINKKTAFTFDQPTGGMGFFECINDKKAAFLMFDKCKEWLMERGMKAMDGPVNFGEKDRFWGLLSEGDDKPAVYTMNHNPPYYKQFFEEYGFTIYYEQILYRRSAIDPPSQRLIGIAERVTRDKSYHFETLNKANAAKYAEDFRTIYNKAWKAERADYEELTHERALALMKKLRPVMDEDVNWFAYHNNEPIGVFIALPELNIVFRHIHGNLNLIGKLKFLWHRRKGIRTFMGIVFGIVPEFQGKGIEAAIFVELGKRIQPKKTYDDLLINWIGGFNDKMIHLLVALLQVTPYKKFITYRKIF